MLEGKQLELSKRLKEISLKNDLVIFPSTLCFGNLYILFTIIIDFLSHKMYSGRQLMISERSMRLKNWRLLMLKNKRLIYIYIYTYSFLCA